MSIIIPANSATGNNLGYQVANGVRFNSASSESLSRDPSSSGSLIGTNTISFWVKRSTDNTEAFLVYAIYDANYRFKATFLANGKLQLNTIIGGSNNLVYETNRLFRDTSPWYHLVFAFDGRLAVSAGDRCRIYVNGVEETSFSTEENMGSDTSNFMSDKDADVYIGAQATGNFFDGYISEFVFIDEQQLTPTSFGEFNADSGVWQPLESVADLTFGTNGFYLDFQDSSALGNDVSGNNNDYTANNLAAIDQTTDTCTNNFALLNSIDNGYGTINFTQGNTQGAGSGSGWKAARASMGVSSGKWYWEMNMTGSNQMGVSNETIDMDNDNAQDLVGVTVFYNSSGGIIRTDGSQVGGTTATFAADGSDVAGYALDMDNKTLSIYKNGSIIVTNTALSTSITDFALPFFSVNGGGDWKVNFGNPSVALDNAGVADGNGRGSFEYAPPSGYLSLCSLNLSEELS